jgi:hypothetical protein
VKHVQPHGGTALARCRFRAATVTRRRRGERDFRRSTLLTAERGVGWTVVLLAVVMLAVGAPFAVAQYLTRLPWAPSCPHCRAVTAQSGGGSTLDRVWVALATTPVRRCTRCGWQGRMRWRWATQRAHPGGQRR